METTNIQICIDTELKRQAESLFSDLGLNMSSAITMFLKKAVWYDGIPFDVTRCKPNEATMVALMEHEQMAADDKTYKRYDSFAELLSEVSEDA